MSRKRRGRRKLGDIVAISLEGNRVGFGWVLEEPLFAFFDHSCDKEAIPPISEIIKRPIAFRVMVMSYAVTSGHWPVIGSAPVPVELLETPWFFKQDGLTDELFLTKVGAGDEIPATREQIRDLERASVWNPEHVEERLQDHFAGRPSALVERMKKLR